MAHAVVDAAVGDDPGDDIVFLAQPGPLPAVPVASGASQHDAGPRLVLSEAWIRWSSTRSRRHRRRRGDRRRRRPGRLAADGHQVLVVTHLAQWRLP